MSQQKNWEMCGSSAETSYGGTLRSARRFQYTNTEAPGFVNQNYMVGHRQEAATGEGAYDQAAQVSSIGKDMVKMPKLQEPSNTWFVERESLEFLTKDQIMTSRNELLRQCNLRHELLVSAIHKFEMYDQLFRSTCDNASSNSTADILATFQVVRRIGGELFPPQREFSLAVTRYRYFVLRLIERLPLASDSRERKTSQFNDLSHEFEDKENAIRVTMANISAKVGGDSKKKMEMYMKAFKRRVDVLESQQTSLDLCASECLEELE